MNEEIVCFKLITGEEILARDITNNETAAKGEITLDRPRVLGLKTGHTLGFFALMISAQVNEPIILNRSAVAFRSVNIRPDIIDAYKNEVSGLIVPPSGIITE